MSENEQKVENILGAPDYHMQDTLSANLSQLQAYLRGLMAGSHTGGAYFSYGINIPQNYLTALQLAIKLAKEKESANGAKEQVEANEVNQ